MPLWVKRSRSGEIVELASKMTQQSHAARAAHAMAELSYRLCSMTRRCCQPGVGQEAACATQPLEALLSLLLYGSAVHNVQAYHSCSKLLQDEEGAALEGVEAAQEEQGEAALEEEEAALVRAQLVVPGGGLLRLQLERRQ